MNVEEVVESRTLEGVGRENQGARPQGRYMVLGILGLVYALSYADRQLILVLAEPIKQELHLTDTQIGLLGGFAFAVFYTVFGIPIAWMADRWNRVRIVAVACGLWSLFTVACGFAGSFIHLALARMGVGVGEAGGTAPSFSMLSDLFPPSERGKAIALFTFGSPIGVMIGTAAGGAIAASFGWRAAFLAFGVSGIAVTLLLLLAVREPNRGGLDSPDLMAAAPPPTPLTTIRLFLSERKLWMMILAAGIGGFVAIGLAAWVPAYLMRSKGMSLMEVSVYYSIVAGLAVCVGVLVGGMLGDRLARRNPRAYALLPAGLFALSLPFLWAAIQAPAWPLALALLAVPLCCTSTVVPPALTFIHNNTPPTHRATASAIFLLVLNFIGIGGGPLFVGVVSDAASRAGVVDSLDVGMMGLCGMLVVAVLALMATAKSIPLVSRDT